MDNAINHLLEMIEDGILDKDVVIMACIKWMGGDEVREMAHANEFNLDEFEE